MANKKISQLTEFTGSTTGVYTIINTSDQTATYKVTKETLTSNLATTGSNIFIGQQTITGSLNITSVINLSQIDPLPSGNVGDLAVSGSALYFFNGTQWGVLSAAPTPSPTPSLSVTPSVSVTPSTTPSAGEVSVTPTITPSVTPSISTTPSAGGVSVTPTVTPSATPSSSTGGEPSVTPSVSTTPSAGGVSVTPTVTPSSTPTIPANTFNVTANGSSAYIINGQSNPTLSIIEGQSYTFNISASGHPFWIKVISSIGTSNGYYEGVTNNGTDNGTITFAVPYDAPSTLYYNCQFHSSMAGTINVTDTPIPSPTPTVTASVTPSAGVPSVTPSISITPSAGIEPSITPSISVTPSAGGPSITPSITPTKTPSPTSTPTPYTIGQAALGGTIAYILQSGDPGYDAGVQHGLVATATDTAANAVWGCPTTAITGADGIVIGTGNQNTIDIMAGCATAGIAARLCGDLSEGGYSDWYLPSKNELNKLYLNKTAIGGFADYVYWSSTESDTFGAWGQDFTDGTSNFYSKSSNPRVRAIRSF